MYGEELAEMNAINKILGKILLDCNEATRLISIKKYGRLSAWQRMQLKMHLSICEICKRFSIFNELIDNAMPHVCNDEGVGNEKLSDEKKKTIDKYLKANTD